MENRQSWTLWFIGLHGSGKTTLSSRIADILRKKGMEIVLLDGHEVRKSISSDLGYSLEDRNIHMQRVADLCSRLNNEGKMVIAAVASPTEKSRDYAKKAIKNFFTVYVKCPLEICEKRDVKGHYKKARLGEKGFEHFLGIGIRFEEPKNPDIVLETSKYAVEECVGVLLGKMKERNILR